MNAFNLGDYVDVPTRLAEALKRWPDLRIQETKPIIVTVDNQQYVEISCTVWNDANDLMPTVAYCWEPIPGRTPYTKGSEMMNASTSCLGRALGMKGMGIGKSIASRNEVQARQPSPIAEVTPIREDLEQPFGDTTDTKPIIVTVDNQQYVEISCTVWRDCTDLMPTVAYCWEPIPGRTPYTKGSEMMNASTSCLGRALGFLGMGIGKSIASRNEVQARQPSPIAEVTPIREDLEQPFGDTTDNKQYASPKQRGMIRALAFEKKIGTTQLLPYINKLLSNQYSSIEALSKQEASQVIESLQT